MFLETLDRDSTPINDDKGFHFDDGLTLSTKIEEIESLNYENLCTFMNLSNQKDTFQSEISKLRLENIIAQENVNDRYSNLVNQYHEAKSRKHQLEAKLDYLKEQKFGRIPTKIEKKLLRISEGLDKELKEAEKVMKETPSGYRHDLIQLQQRIIEVQSTFKEGTRALKKAKNEKKKLKRYLGLKLKRMVDYLNQKFKDKGDSEQKSFQNVKSIVNYENEIT